jgi:hypothetical protein
MTVFTIKLSTHTYARGIQWCQRTYIYRKTCFALENAKIGPHRFESFYRPINIHSSNLAELKSFAMTIELRMGQAVAGWTAWARKCDAGL